MIDMSRTDGLCIKDHPKISGGIDPLDWLAGWGFGMLLPALVKSVVEFFETLVEILNFFFQPPL